MFLVFSYFITYTMAWRGTSKIVTRGPSVIPRGEAKGYNRWPSGDNFWWYPDRTLYEAFVPWLYCVFEGVQIYNIIGGINLNFVIVLTQREISEKKSSFLVSFLLCTVGCCWFVHTYPFDLIYLLGEICSLRIYTWRILAREMIHC